VWRKKGFAFAASMLTALPVTDEAKLHLSDHAQHTQDHAAHRIRHYS
jgi:hypothetical protein